MLRFDKSIWVCEISLKCTLLTPFTTLFTALCLCTMAFFEQMVRIWMYNGIQVTKKVLTKKFRARSTLQESHGETDRN